MASAWERIEADREARRRAHLREVKIVGLIGWLLFWVAIIWGIWG